VSGLTLDAGALIAYERADREVVGRLKHARQVGSLVYVPAGVVGQVWRDGRRQAPLAQLLASRNLRIRTLDPVAARMAGRLCGVTGTSDVIDASVVLCAREFETAIVTSDPHDLRRLDRTVDLIVV